MGFKKWVVKSDNIEINEIKLKAQVFSKKFKISLIVAEILIIRGMDTEEKIQNHLLNNNFSNPFLLKDMEKAVERIKIAYENQEKILICGDYDADGITATYILYHYLENYGCDVKFYIPERSDGYGLSKKLIASAKNNSITLIITVDNGISCFEEIEFSKAMGIDVIVTDHHKPPEKIPVCCAVIDPHQEDCQSPIGAKNLCGAGVALKLILAIEGEEDYLESFCFEYYCQIAAIGTIADIVSLKDENRFIVQKGIEFIKNSDVSGLIALFNNAGVDIKKVNSGNIAFGIVPRINATGRMNSAKMALNLLLCENEEEVLFYVNEISSQNNKRKETEQFIIEEIEKDIKENPEKLNGRIGIFYNQGWNHGVIGIVCARLMEKLQKPIILISIENGEARG
ncbi:MAG: DHH family phosphoesterase, partial [Oscillospiraceae bacterium]